MGELKSMNSVLIWTSLKVCVGQTQLRLGIECLWASSSWMGWNNGCNDYDQALDPILPILHSINPGKYLSMQLWLQEIKFTLFSTCFHTKLNYSMFIGLFPLHSLIFSISVSRSVLCTWNANNIHLTAMQMCCKADFHTSLCHLDIHGSKTWEWINVHSWGLNGP